MLTERTSPSLWFIESPEENIPTNGLNTSDQRSLVSYYPYSSLYKAETLINGHLKKNWNTCWTKVVAVNQVILGLLILILGVLIVFFQLSFSNTAHGIWTGILVFLAGLFAFLTIIYRHYRFFLFVACFHILTGLASTAMIFISIYALAIQMKKNLYSMVDLELNYAFHITLITLGLYEKLLCYIFLIMIIRHTHKMV